MNLKKISAACLAAAMICTSVPELSLAADYFKTDSLIEAELGSVRVNMLQGADEYSSGGKYIYSNLADVTNASVIAADEASYLISVEKEQTYRLYARVYMPTAKQTQFFYRWERGEWQTYSGEKNDDYVWADLGTVVLKPGVRKLEIAHKQKGVVFDCFMLSSDTENPPAAPENVKSRPNAASGGSFVQKQTEEFKVTGLGGVFEAENARLNGSTAVKADKSCSGGANVFVTDEAETRDTPDIGEDGYIEVDFSTDQTRNYSVWARILAPTGANDSCFTKVADGKYVGLTMKTGSEYGWYRVGSIDAEAGKTYTIKIRPREAKWSIDQFAIAAKSTYVPDGIVKAVENVRVPELVPETALPPYNPPQEHPRVYFRKSDIPHILEKMEVEENASAKQNFLDTANSTINMGTAYDANVLTQAEAKAFYYQLYGDKQKGREAIDAILQAADWEIEQIQDVTRVYGNAIEALAEVYDWCYDLLSENEKLTLIDNAVGWASFMEIGWPPNLQGSLVGHGAETQFLRDDLSFAIAVADERPDIWNYIGGKFYANYVPERQWHLNAQFNHQGNNYGTYRNYCSCYAWLLITGMGLPEPYSGYMVGTTSYSHRLYLRRPDGMVFLDGDMFSSSPMTYLNGGTGDLALELACSKDPAIKGEMIRLSRLADKNGVKIDTGLSGAKWLIFSQPQVEWASRESLPFAYYFGSPMGIMAARTGWEEGLNANVAVAEMKVGEYWFGNHQHKDAGSFQLYYKGPLATDSGFYQNGVFYGSSDHYNYTMQSVAHNTILVYDPAEDKTDFAGMVNDGGQRWPDGIMQTTYQNILSDPKHHRASVMAHEIDTKNQMDPDYTYLKGDITNAYSNKISDFKRSFMFLNLRDEKIPAALIVFDKLSVPDASLEKTWLLHGQQDPVIDGARTIWKSSPYTDKDTGEKYTGKMVHDSLLPAADKISMKVASGPEIGWNNIRGTNYAHPDTSPEREENTYRLEISPTENSQDNYFLNVMQVTDEDNSQYLTPELVETDEFYGVKISDRVVMFSKSGEKVSSEITLPEQSETVKYTICDMPAGTYSVTTSAGSGEVKVSEEGAVLSFEAEPGTVTINKTSDEAAANQKNLEPKEVQSGVLKVDGNIVGLSTAPDIVNGKYMVPAEDIYPKLRSKREKGFLKEVFTDKDQDITVTIRPESDVMIVNDKTVHFSNPTYYKNGKLMVELRPFAEAFNYIVNWDSSTSSPLLVSDRKVIVKPVEGYAKAIGAKNDGGTIDSANQSPNVLDNDLTTLWAAEGIGRYFDIELEEETILENVEIIFNPNSKRTPYFEIHISSDGENFEKIYDGKGSPEADGMNWEVFKFNPRNLYKAKYIRYVSNGSDMSRWAGVKEMRFKIGSEMTVWELPDNFAKIILTKDDGGEIDGDNTADNLADSNSRTVWSALGSGRYVDFELEGETDISGVDIVFNSETRRSARFAISVSSDGEHFEKVFEGRGNPDAPELTWESFEFGKTVKAKYVRYIGFGSNLGLQNSVNEIRIRK